MILSERRGGGEDGQSKSLLTASASAPKPYLFSIFGVQIRGTHLSLLVAIVALAILLGVPMLESEEASRCLAILVFATILWATEVRFLGTMLDTHSAVRFFVCRQSLSLLLPFWFLYLLPCSG
jgi:hypothetical protein